MFSRIGTIGAVSMGMAVYLNRRAVNCQAANEGGYYFDTKVRFLHRDNCELCLKLYL